MLFHRPHISEVLKGKRTWTLYPSTGGPCPYKVARTYAIQSRWGGPGIARIFITRYHEEPVDALDLEDPLDIETVEGHEKAWVIHFKLHREEEELYLAHGAGDGYGYTTSPTRAMRDEPACIPREVLKEYAERGWDVHSIDRRSLADQVAEIERTPGMASYLAAIERKVRVAQQASRKKAA